VGARPALDRLRRLGVPLVFVTSKTRSEVVALQEEMSMDEPFVTENGGAVFLPLRYGPHSPVGAERHGGLLRVVLGRSYREVRSFFVSLAGEYELRGFGDLGTSEIAELTGLSPDQARRAQQREFSEPFLVGPETPLEELRILARESGFEVLEGGRFFHLVGRGHDKGRAVEVLEQVLRSSEPDRLLTIAIGDAPNDLPMLERADVGVLLPGRDGSFADRGRLPLRRASQRGSQGWNQVVLELLGEIV
jgi:mannosyl-3-phosphoglycerate phosphatase